MSGLRVLYVDDEPDIREVACIALRLDPDLEVRSTASGTAALELLAAGDWTPDVIMLDVMMPGLDGPGTLARLRELPASGRTPVVFITARTQTQEKERFLGLGALAVITKPFDPMSLAKEVRAILGERAVLTEPAAALAALETRFSARSAEDLSALKAHRDGSATLDPEALRLLVHRLAGAAGTFGHHAVSVAAGDAEDDLLTGAAPRLKALIRAVEAMLAA